jgi:hypothetical protein
MNDDWRQRITFHDGGRAPELREHLEATDLEHELAGAFHDRVVVSVDGPDVFLYAGTREQAERAEQLIRSLAPDRG